MPHTPSYQEPNPTITVEYSASTLSRSRTCAARSVRLSPKVNSRASGAARLRLSSDRSL
jgi:hypothetical protein